jgi:hypothetical protein
MKWKFWQSQPQVAPVEEEDGETGQILPSLHIEIIPGSQAYVSCEWGQPETDEEALQIASDMAGLIVLLQNGGLLPQMQFAVSSYGERSDTGNVSRGILHLVNQSLVGKQAPGPVVRPRMAFQPRE